MRRMNRRDHHQQRSASAREGRVVAAVGLDNDDQRGRNALLAGCSSRKSSSTNDGENLNHRHSGIAAETTIASTSDATALFRSDSIGVIILASSTTSGTKWASNQTCLECVSRINEAYTRLLTSHQRICFRRFCARETHRWRRDEWTIATIKFNDATNELSRPSNLTTPNIKLLKFWTPFDQHVLRVDDGVGLLESTEMR